jgi:uncharacterized membrane protein (DUF485 family)
MQFEDLQAIWDTQNARPVFAMNDSRLAVGLYQQREQSRRRLFRSQFAPLYVSVLMLAVFLLFLFLAFYAKTVYRMRITDPLMSVWDGALLVLAMAAVLAVVVPMYTDRRKHERGQDVFAPSLREELERGISQLDFELSLHSAPRSWRIVALVSIGASAIVWESGRLNGDPAPWTMLAFSLIATSAGSLFGLVSKKKIVERSRQRRRALESMLAALTDENAS